MAETCIVCLGDLNIHDPAVDVSDGPSNSKSPLSVLNPNATLDSPQLAPQTSAGELVAHLLPCGHYLHDECLKPWVERANSCPICRQTFNMVELSASLGGPVISSYPVQNKQQVADFDPSMIIDDEGEEEDVHNGPCHVCEAFGEDSELMYCDGCSNTCHIACAGMDSLPSGTFFCYTCQEDPQILANSPNRRTGTTRSRRARGARPLAWERVWRSVYDRLDFDLDFPFEQEDTAAQRRAEAERREVQEWRRRFAVAQRQGPRAATRFRDTAVILREHQRNRPSPESQEEIKAWNAFERFRALEEGDGQQAGRNRRKRKSPTASPRDVPTAPERKLKRPRTRAPNIGEGSSSAAESSRASRPRPPVPSAPRPRRPIPEGAGAPTFLQSLLSEVEANPWPSGPTLEQNDYGSDALSGNERSPSPRNESSPDASPAASNHPSPRVMTPGPHSPTARPASPAPLTSIITPVFPPAPEFSPFSPAENSPDRSRSRQRKPNGSSPAHSPSHSPSRAPISYEMKAEIQKMVSAALKPHYHRKELDKDAYTEINRDVSRMLYDKVWDAGGLVDVATRDRFQKVAAEEVAIAVKALKKTDLPPDKSTPETTATASATPTFTAVVRA